MRVGHEVEEAAFPVQFSLHRPGWVCAGEEQQEQEEERSRKHPGSTEKSQ